MNKRIKKLAAPTEEEVRTAGLEAENARLQARVEEAERQLRDQVTGDLGEYLEVVGLGVAAWKCYVDYVDGRYEFIRVLGQQLYEEEQENETLRVLAERRKEVLVKLLEENVLMPPMIILDVHAAIEEAGICQNPES